MKLVEPGHEVAAPLFGAEDVRAVAREPDHRPVGVMPGRRIIAGLDRAALARHFERPLALRIVPAGAPGCQRAIPCRRGHGWRGIVLPRLDRWMQRCVDAGVEDQRRPRQPEHDEQQAEAQAQPEMKTTHEDARA
ncbi:hypothetical protein QP165_03100 [Sphingomonas sp. 22R3R2A-7]